MRKELTAIIESAAHLSQTMRKHRDTVYYWPPTFKDEEFDPDRMECSDLRGMILVSPYDTRETSQGFERPMLREGHDHEDTAVVRVVCFPGLISFQQGGGEIARSEIAMENGRPDNAPPDVQQQRKLLAKRNSQKQLTGDEGFRTRLLCKSIVLLQWGKQRLLTKEAGTSAHLNAKRSNEYHQDSETHVELYDLFEETLERETDEIQSSWLPKVTRLFSRSPSVGPVGT